MNRRRFLGLGVGSVAATALGACNSFGPGSAKSLLELAELALHLRAIVQRPE